MTILIPILGDQLSHGLAALQDVAQRGAAVLMMEVADETTYVRHAEAFRPTVDHRLHAPLARHERRFRRNRRMANMYATWDRMQPDARDALRSSAAAFLDGLEPAAKGRAR